MAILGCKNLSCHRAQWHAEGLSCIHGVTLSLESGRFYGFSGPDGCGKGLLLNVLGLLEPPDTGEVLLLDQPVSAWDEDEKRHLCNEAFGFLFTHPCLLPSFTVAENVAMPLFRICGADAREARVRTLEMLQMLDITDLEGVLAGRLDPATQQRVALARALVHRPKVLIAISPRNADELRFPVGQIAHEMGVCVLWSGEYLENDDADVIFELNEGRVVRQTAP